MPPINLQLAAAMAAHILLGALPAPAAPTKPGVAAPIPEVVAGHEAEPGAPAGGSPQDRALWRSMLTDHHQIAAQRGLAHRLYYRLRPEREDGRLAALAQERPELGPRIESLRKRLRDARRENYRLMSVTWPVEPRRGCRAEMLDLAGAIDAPAGQERARSLETARQQAKACTEKLRSVLLPLRESNRALQAAVDEVDGLLASAPALPTVRARTTGTEDGNRGGDERAGTAAHPENMRPAGPPGAAEDP